AAKLHANLRSLYCNGRSCAGLPIALVSEQGQHLIELGERNWPIACEQNAGREAIVVRFHCLDEGVPGSDECLAMKITAVHSSSRAGIGNELLKQLALGSSLQPVHHCGSCSGSRCVLMKSSMIFASCSSAHTARSSSCNLPFSSASSACNLLFS